MLQMCDEATVVESIDPSSCEGEEGTGGSQFNRNAVPSLFSLAETKVATSVASEGGDDELLLPPMSAWLHVSVLRRLATLNCGAQLQRELAQFQTVATLCGCGGTVRQQLIACCEWL